MLRRSVISVNLKHQVEMFPLSTDYFLVLVIPNEFRFGTAN